MLSDCEIQSRNVTELLHACGLCSMFDVSISCSVMLCKGAIRLLLEFASRAPDSIR